MCVLGRSGPRVVSLSPCFRGGVCWRSDVLLEQMQLNFSFRNKLIILFFFFFLLKISHFQKCVFLKVLPLHWLLCLWKPKCSLLDNNKIEGNEELMLVVLNCTLLHNRNDCWTVPYPHLIECCKNICLRILFKEAYIAWSCNSAHDSILRHREVGWTRDLSANLVI
jgi:hypothetical protein